MTQRERFASGGANDAAARPVGGPEAPSHAGAAPDAAAPAGPLWEDVFRHATADQQRQLLALARQQGLLYTHQLPTSNGSASVPPPGRPRLPRLLAGHAEDLEPARPEHPVFFDAALDPDQREAVARALATPDVCLIQGLPGTGKSRVVAEILLQAAARGERVLLLAPTAAAVDHALELVGDRDELCPVRCLGADERPEALPPSVRGLTVAERGRHFREHPLRHARRQLEAAEQRAARLRGAEPVLDRLREIALRHQEIDLQSESVRQRRARLAQEVEREAADRSAAGAFAADMAVTASRHREELAAADAFLVDRRRRRDECTRERDELVPRVEGLRQLTRAKGQGRWWTASWWRAVFQQDLPARLAELDARRQQVESDLDGLDRDIDRLVGERRRAEEAFAAEWQRRVGDEAARRREQFDAQEAALGHERQLLQQKWQAACQELGDGGTPPAALTPATVQDAAAAWRQSREETERQAAFSREWVRYLEENAGELTERLVRYANLVASTTAALPADPHFGDGASAAPFDLLVLQEADQVTKSEFLGLARRARRWVLVGEPDLTKDEGGRMKDESIAGVAGSSIHPSSFRLHPSFFHGLWRTLHCDPRDLPYAWVAERGRLCCRLSPVTAEERQWLESERVADCPDVELRILAAPRARPVLAEVVFPASYSIVRAKAYIYRELEELPVWGAGSCLRWREQPGRLALEVGPPAPADAVAVELEAGVREVVASAGPRPWATYHFEFDAAAGWQRPRAEQWVEKHLGLRDLGRTAVLDAPHRMAPPLAAFLSDLLFAGAYRPPSRAREEVRDADRCTRHGAAAVEFVSTAPLQTQARRPADKEARRKKTTDPGPSPLTPRPRVSLPATGAGLELDLAERRHRDRLPTEFREGLPGHGYVNYLEARLVVRALEALASSPCACTGNDRSALAVIALYPAQAALIRRLVRESPALAAPPFGLAVGVPEEFRKRECPVVLLSLTRSHGHRAVTFGEGPRQLALALSRARRRLVLFGDPGTLVRRSQWDGPLDHLDAAAAARERDLVVRLVRYLEGSGAHPASFLLREGCGS